MFALLCFFNDGIKVKPLYPNSKFKGCDQLQLSLFTSTTQKEKLLELTGPGILLK